MISHRLKSIFVHIPKTGGTSIERTFWREDEFVEENLWMGFVSKFSCKYQTGGLQHLRASQIRREVGQNVFDSYFKFSVVRNPWDRLVSAYHYCQRHPGLFAYAGIDTEASFDHFLASTAKRRHVHWEPQVRFLYDDDGRCLVDKVCRFERLVDEVSGIGKKLGQKVDAVPHLGKSKRRHYSEYYDATTRAFVADRYAADIRMFHYEF